MKRILRSNRFDPELWEKLQELSVQKKIDVSKLLDRAISDLIRKNDDPIPNIPAPNSYAYIKQGTLKHVKDNTWRLQISTGEKSEKGKYREKVYTIKAESQEEAEKERQKIVSAIRMGIIP